MTTEEFVDILEQRQLVSASIIRQVREKIAKGDRRLNAKSLLKYLVKKELLSRTQAKQLLETTLTVSPSAESSILGIISLPAMPAERLSDQASDLDEDIPILSPLGELDAVDEEEERQRIERDNELAAISGFVTAALDKDKESATPTSGGREAKSKKKKRLKKNEFDSPLLLLGGGGLIVLILAGVVIGYLLIREDADAVLAGAKEYYQNQSYAQAVTEYERFVKTFPRHPEASAAMVQLGLAKIWKATSGVTQYSPALETTKQVLGEIEDEKEFQLARDSLASLLPSIAEGLAGQAEKATDPQEVIELVAQANEALALCNNTKYIPSTYQNVAKLEEIRETLDRVQRQQEQKANLDQGLKDIQAAIESGNSAEAYAVRNRLVEKNPGLLNDESLANKVREISAAEQGVVKFVAETKTAETSPRPTNLVAQLALAGRRGPTASVEGTIPARVDGAVYSLNAGDGKLLWRQHVGSGPSLPPTLLADGDMLVIDAVHHELLRLEATTGKLVWRQSFDGPILVPVSLEDRLLVAEQSGKLHVVRAESGERIGFVHFGQPLPVPPAIAARGHRIYIIGEHSSVYTLSAEDFSCLGVYFLGHENGSIAVPPVTVLNKLMVVENAGLETSNLHVLSSDDDDRIAAEDTSRRLTGLVTTPLLVDGRRLVALTTFGQVAVYEVGSGEGEEALAQIAAREAEPGPPVARFGLLLDGHIWLAGNELTKLAVLPTENRLQLRNIDRDFGGDTFDYPLQVVGGVVLYVRRAQGQAGAIVGAMEAESGKALWETELAVPLAGAPAIDSAGPTISAMTVSGAAYVLDREAMTARVQDEAQRLSSTAKLPPPAESVDLGQGRLALASAGSKAILHFNPNASAAPLTGIQLAAPLSSPPVAWDDAFVAPTRVGQVYLYDSNTAEQVGGPFQPPLAAEESFEWLRPAVFGVGAESRLLLSDGVAKIYLLRHVSDPEPHLEAEAEAKVSNSPLATGMVVVGNTVYAGTKGGGLARFALPSLEIQPEVDLDARVAWGPFAVGDGVLLATTKDELMSINAEGNVAWRRPLAHGEPCGQPVADGAGVIVLWREGGLSRLGNQDGAETAYLEFNQPVTAGPVAFANRLLVGSADGALLVVNRPGSQAE